MRQYVVKNIAGSAGRWLDVAPGRFPRWIASFAQRHGFAQRQGGAGDRGQDPDLTLTLSLALTRDTVIFTAPDGAVAECHPPFPPVAMGDPLTPAACAEAVAAHALAPRTVGVLLVRLGGYAVGVFAGSPPELKASKTGSRLVHGRSAAGGWSQHRFARRREKQASEALAAAAGAAAGVFGTWAAGPGDGDRDNSKRRGPGAVGPSAVGLDALVLGGDKRAMAELRGDPRLAPYLEAAVERFLTVPDPKLTVLKGAPDLYLAVRIRLSEPAT